jgi:hypothetical protein
LRRLIAPASRSFNSHPVSALKSSSKIISPNSDRRSVVGTGLRWGIGGGEGGIVGKEKVGVGVTLTTVTVGVGMIVGLLGIHAFIHRHNVKVKLTWIRTRWYFDAIGLLVVCTTFLDW